MQKPILPDGLITAFEKAGTAIIFHRKKPHSSYIFTPQAALNMAKLYASDGRPEDAATLRRGAVATGMRPT